MRHSDGKEWIVVARCEPLLDRDGDRLYLSALGGGTKPREWSKELLSARRFTMLAARRAAREVGGLARKHPRFGGTE